MVTRIQKWGNSLGLRIPKSFAEDAGVDAGSPVNLSIEGDRLIIRPVHRTRYELKDLVSQIREDNLHDEVPMGEPVGREVW
jgi:antitoxin MazE